MLLDHLGAMGAENALSAAAACLSEATDGLLAAPETRTRDLGGGLGIKAFGEAVAEVIRDG